MTSTSDLLTRWRELITAGEAGQREVDSSHPLRLLFGTDQNGRPLFSVMSRTRPREPDLPEDVVETVVTVRPDGFHMLLLSLRDRQLFEVFAKLCEDLAARSHDARDELDALKEVYGALAEWKRLLRAQPDHMSIESLRGLVAELAHGLTMAEERPVEEVFANWRGPFGAHQDFQFEDGQCVEVKAVRPGITWVRIASEHQLESLGGPLTLAVLELADATRDAPDAISLPTLLSRIRRDLALTPLALQAFETALSELRDQFNHSFYEEHWFRIRRTQLFEVSEDFPRLTPAALPDGISAVAYRLSLQAIAPFVFTD